MYAKFAKSMPIPAGGKASGEINLDPYPSFKASTPMPVKTFPAGEGKPFKTNFAKTLQSDSTWVLLDDSNEVVDSDTSVAALLERYHGKEPPRLAVLQQPDDLKR
jgi:hypothetical protein